jgi:hypothetical protein
MTSRYTLTLIALALAASACSKNPSTELSTQAYPVGERWNATLGTPTELAGVAQLRGNAWMAHAGNETRVQINIQNATPGGRHPWHVHQGECGSDRGVLGPADRYGILEVNNEGRASRTITLPIGLPATGMYMVNVHASAENPGTIVACGNLAAPTN